MTAAAGVLALGFAVCAIVLLSRVAGLLRHLATQPEREALCLSTATAQTGDLSETRHEIQSDEWGDYDCGDCCGPSCPWCCDRLVAEMGFPSYVPGYEQRVLSKSAQA
ncbi:hypothetical protein RDV84_19310 [Lysobacter yananisis]|uniref:4Fe-4S ferredoxin-type domain-containing protein n=1 Tax=Lysobacter yananisis TaxID=1003114 RepID=A0ABY9P4W0_9GAMM|nr:hypothetical protein [Lysobacter yananisis]WMT02092.1 hypothetical protein RDV84_19310 [Lysobacter yananisis]